MDKNSSQIIPFNNYGQYFLRVKICIRTVQAQKYGSYRIVDPGNCKSLSEYQLCTRWVPPLTFVPVAVPASTYFVEVDSCQVFHPVTGVAINRSTDIIAGASPPFTFNCFNGDPAPPARIYGNKVLWPTSYDVAQTAVSICSSDGKRHYQHNVMSMSFKHVYVYVCVCVLCVYP